MDITEQQKELLTKLVPDYESLDRRELLSRLDFAMADSLDENGESTKETTSITKLYDSIYTAT